MALSWKSGGGAGADVVKVVTADGQDGQIVRMHGTKNARNLVLSLLNDNSGNVVVAIYDTQQEALMQERELATVQYVDSQAGLEKIYSTTERKVGTYLGKDLYEITYTNVTVPAYRPDIDLDRHGALLLNTLGFNDSWTIVDFEGVAQMGTTSIMCTLPMSYATKYESNRTPYSDARTIGLFKFADGWTLYNTDTQPYTCKGLTLRYVKEVL